MKAFLLGDIHLHITNIDIVNKIVDWLIANKKDETHIIIAGDFFHRATRQSVDTLVAARNIIDRLNEHFKIVALAGNHDLTKRDIDFRTSPLVLYDIEALALNFPVKYENLFLIPYTAKQEQWDSWIKLIPDDVDFVIAHQFFKQSNPKYKFLYSPFKESKDINLPYSDAIKLADIPKFVISGHIHVPRNFGSYMYLGSVFPLNKTEENEHFIYRFDTDRKKITAEPVNFLNYFTVTTLDKSYNNPNNIIYANVNEPEEKVREFYNKVRKLIINKVDKSLAQAKEIKLTTAEDIIITTIENSKYDDSIKDRVKEMVLGG